MTREDSEVLAQQLADLRTMRDGEGDAGILGRVATELTMTAVDWSRDGRSSDAAVLVLLARVLYVLHREDGRHGGVYPDSWRRGAG